MKLVIVTGLSGAGKSEALNIFEDMGFYCVDNLPATLLPKIAEISMNSKGNLSKLAIGIDARGYRFFDDLSNGLNQLKSLGIFYDIIFLEADEKTLIKRYKMTRRSHPLAKEGNLYEAILEERNKLLYVRNESKYIINTSEMASRELKHELYGIFECGGKEEKLLINVSSFGFKHGIPMDADLVFDVRFMPNPYYDEQLRPLTGDDLNVQNFVMNNEDSKIFFDKLIDMIEFLIPQYIKEGKTQLSIAIGCTGGKHRSVTISNLLYAYLKEKNYKVFKRHRDYNLS